MQFVDLYNRVQLLISYGGSADIAVPPNFADLPTYYKALANRGLQDFSWDTEYNMEQATFTTVANQAEYVLTTPGQPDWKYFLDVIYGTTVRLFPTTEQEVWMRDPLWLVAPAGQPSYQWTPAPNTVHLHPKPSTSGDVITVRGVRQAPPMVGDTDTPLFPATWHEGVALRGAILHLEVFAQGAEMDRLTMYRAQYDGHVAACKDWMGDDNIQIQRTVRLRLPQRISLGAYTGGGGYPTL